MSQFVERTEQKVIVSLSEVVKENDGLIEIPLEPIVFEDVTSINDAKVSKAIAKAYPGKTVIVTGKKLEEHLLRVTKEAFRQMAEVLPPRVKAVKGE